MIYQEFFSGRIDGRLVEFLKKNDEDLIIYSKDGEDDGGCWRYDGKVVVGDMDKEELYSLFNRALQALSREQRKESMVEYEKLAVVGEVVKGDALLSTITYEIASVREEYLRGIVSFEQARGVLIAFDRILHSKERGELSYKEKLVVDLLARTANEFMRYEVDLSPGL